MLLIIILQIDTILISGNKIRDDWHKIRTPKPKPDIVNVLKYALHTTPIIINILYIAFEILNKRSK